MKVLWQLFATFLKIGTFTFGGGFAMIPIIRREITEKRRWSDEMEIADYIAISQSLPGSFAVNVAIFIGKKIKGSSGAVVSCIGLVFPAYLTILLILIFLGTVGDNVYIIGAFEGIKAASVALILVAMIQLGKGILKDVWSWLLACVSLAAVVLLSLSAIYAILGGGIIGYFQYRYRKYREGAAG